MSTSPDGSLNSAQAELGIRRGDIDLIKCENKRQLLIDSWPTNEKLNLKEGSP